MNKETDYGAIYTTGMYITGFIGFVILWIWAIGEWGVLLGLVFGWIPALIGGVISGLLWPVIAALIALCILITWNNSNSYKANTIKPTATYHLYYKGLSYGSYSDMNSCLKARSTYDTVHNYIYCGQ